MAEPLGGVILCGGRSRRMGQPKAWLPFGPEALLQRVARRLAETASTIVVVAAPGQDLPPLPATIRVVRDPVEGLGPLQGLASGFAALPECMDLAYATATDVPFLQPAWINRLSALIGDHAVAIPRVDGYHHPLAALYRPRAVLPAIASLLKARRMRPIFLLDEVPCRIVTADELRDVDPTFATLRNLNTPEDYAAAAAEAGVGGFRDRAPAAALLEAGPPSDFGDPQMITIELFGVPRLRAGVGRLSLEAGSVAEAIAALGRTCPALEGSVIVGGRLHPAYLLNLNGERFLGEEDRALKPGDRLLLMAVDVGG